MTSDPRDIVITIGGIAIIFLLVGGVLSVISPFLWDGPFSSVIYSLSLVYELIPYLLGGTLLVLGYLLYQLHGGGSGW
jgi:hypothetical protein